MDTGVETIGPARIGPEGRRELILQRVSETVVFEASYTSWCDLFSFYVEREKTLPRPCWARFLPSFFRAFRRAGPSGAARAAH